MPKRQQFVVQLRITEVQWNQDLLRVEKLSSLPQPQAAAGKLDAFPK